MRNIPDTPFINREGEVTKGSRDVAMRICTGRVFPYLLLILELCLKHIELQMILNHYIVTAQKLHCEAKLY